MSPLRLASDRQLVRLVAGGSEPAFGVLYDRYHKGLYAYCRSIVREEEDARDALQSTMLKALTALRRGCKEPAVRPWLFRIAHNESISILRKRRPQVELEEERAGADEGMDATVLNRERIAELLRDLQALSERQRGALVMLELADLDYPEIGEALAMSPTAVRQAVFEARSALSDFAEGRDQGCDTVRRTIADRRRPGRRPRAVRAHLHSCANCRDFDAVQRRRRHDLALLPSAFAASGALDGLGGVAARGGGGLAGALAAAFGGVGGGAPAAVKCGVAVIALCAGGGAIEVVDQEPREGSGSASAAEVAAAPVRDAGGSGTATASARPAAPSASPPAESNRSHPITGIQASGTAGLSAPAARDRPLGKDEDQPGELGDDPVRADRRGGEPGTRPRDHGGDPGARSRDHGGDPSARPARAHPAAYPAGGERDPSGAGRHGDAPHPPGGKTTPRGEGSRPGTAVPPGETAARAGATRDGLPATAP